MLLSFELRLLGEASGLRVHGTDNTVTAIRPGSKAQAAGLQVRTCVALQRLQCTHLSRTSRLTGRHRIFQLGDEIVAVDGEICGGGVTAVKLWMEGRDLEVRSLTVRRLVQSKQSDGDRMTQRGNSRCEFDWDEDDTHTGVARVTKWDESADECSQAASVRQTKWDDNADELGESYQPDELYCADELAAMRLKIQAIVRSFGSGKSGDEARDADTTVRSACRRIDDDLSAIDGDSADLQVDEPKLAAMRRRLEALLGSDDGAQGEARGALRTPRVD